MARDAGLTIVPYQSDLGFTAVYENESRCFVFVLNTGEWMIYQAVDVVLMASGCGRASFLAALHQYFDLRLTLCPMPQRNASRGRSRKPAFLHLFMGRSALSSARPIL